MIEGQLAVMHAKAEAKFYALLAAEQKAKYDEIGARASVPGRHRFAPLPGPGRRP